MLNSLWCTQFFEQEVSSVVKTSPATKSEKMSSRPWRRIPQNRKLLWQLRGSCSLFGRAGSQPTDVSTSAFNEPPSSKLSRDLVHRLISFKHCEIVAVIVRLAERKTLIETYRTVWRLGCCHSSCRTFACISELKTERKGVGCFVVLA
jgi:hypothetical protein